MVVQNGSNEIYGISPILTSPGERVLIAKRKHWFVLLIPLCILVVFFLASNFLGIVVFGFFLKSAFLTIDVVLAAVIIFIAVFSKVIIDWYAHWYIVTTHKILEFWSIPFFSHKINDVMLDQVHCTEVDIQADGILNHILDKGNIEITFDRPTHQEEFVISDIKDPIIVGKLLLESLNSIHYAQEREKFWYKNRIDPSRFQFSEEIVEGQYMGES